MDENMDDSKVKIKQLIEKNVIINAVSLISFTNQPSSIETG